MSSAPPSTLGVPLLTVPLVQTQCDWHNVRADFTKAATSKAKAALTSASTSASSLTAATGTGDNALETVRLISRGINGEEIALTSLRPNISSTSAGSGSCSGSGAGADTASYWLSAYLYDPVKGESRPLHSTITLSSAPSQCSSSGAGVPASDSTSTASKSTAVPAAAPAAALAPAVAVSSSHPAVTVGTAPASHALKQTVTLPPVPSVSSASASSDSAASGSVPASSQRPTVVEVVAPLRAWPAVQGADRGLWTAPPAVPVRRGTNDITDDIAYADALSADADALTANTQQLERQGQELEGDLSSVKPKYDSKGIPIDSVPAFMLKSKNKNNISKNTSSANAAAGTNSDSANSNADKPAPGLYLASSSSSADSGLPSAPGGLTSSRISSSSSIKRTPVHCISVNSALQCLTGGPDGSLKVWNGITGAEIVSLSGKSSDNTDKTTAVNAPSLPDSHIGDVTACAWMPSGVVALSAAADCRIKIWAPFLTPSANTDATLSSPPRRCVKTLPALPNSSSSSSGAELGLAPRGHTRPVTAFSFLCPTGRSFATAARDGAVLLWDTAQGAPVARWCAKGASNDSLHGQSSSGESGSESVLSENASVNTERPLWCLARRGAVLAAGAEDGCVDLIDTRMRGGVAMTLATATATVNAATSGIVSVSVAPSMMRPGLAWPSHPVLHNGNTANDNVLAGSGSSAVYSAPAAVRSLLWTDGSGAAFAEGGQLYAGLGNGIVCCLDPRVAVQSNNGRRSRRAHGHFVSTHDAHGQGQYSWAGAFGPFVVDAEAAAQGAAEAAAAAEANARAQGPKHDDDNDGDDEDDDEDVLLWYACHANAAVTTLLRGDREQSQSSSDCEHEQRLWVGDEEGNMALWSVSSQYSSKHSPASKSTGRASQAPRVTVSPVVSLSGHDGGEAVAAAAAAWHSPAADLASARALAMRAAGAGVGESSSNSAANASYCDWKQRVWTVGPDGARLYSV